MNLCPSELDTSSGARPWLASPLNYRESEFRTDPPFGVLFPSHPQGYGHLTAIGILFHPVSQSDREPVKVPLILRKFAVLDSVGRPDGSPSPPNESDAEAPSRKGPNFRHDHRLAGPRRGRPSVASSTVASATAFHIVALLAHNAL